MPRPPQAAITRRAIAACPSTAAADHQARAHQVLLEAGIEEGHRPDQRRQDDRKGEVRHPRPPLAAARAASPHIVATAASSAPGPASSQRVVTGRARPPPPARPARPASSLGNCLAPMSLQRPVIVAGYRRVAWLGLKANRIRREFKPPLRGARAIRPAATRARAQGSAMSAPPKRRCRSRKPSTAAAKCPTVKSGQATRGKSYSA